jgi:hypothetical protein
MVFVYVHWASSQIHQLLLLLHPPSRVSFRTQATVQASGKLTICMPCTCVVRLCCLQKCAV